MSDKQVLLKNELILYLMSIKQGAKECGSNEKKKTFLNALFEHSILYGCILDNDVLCSEVALGHISEFFALVENVLPPPVSNDGIDLSLALHYGVATDSGWKLPEGSLERANAIFSQVVVDLLTILNLATIELSKNLSELGDLSAVDIENTQYVIGMSEITATNFGMVLERCGEFENSSYEKLHAFFSDSTRFTSKLRESGLGFVS